MKAVIQRVSSASVTVADTIVGSIETGLLVLLGVAEGDQPQDAIKLVDKIINLRIFPNDQGKFDYSVKDIQGKLLVVSQFTLMGDCSKGRRPNFQSSARPDEANALYELFIKEVRQQGISCATGQFQAHMNVSLCNDGPVTLILDTKGV